MGRFSFANSQPAGRNLLYDARLLFAAILFRGIQLSIAYSLRVLILAVLCPAALAQVNGAVYTTDRHAEVDNVFGGKNKVYLAGGPGPNAGCSGNGLADGMYFFQITDPSGSTLLTPESLALRTITVLGGVIDSAAGRNTRSGPCGSRIVQLHPFDTTPSESGEYKVWFTPAASYVPGAGSHGFLSSASKTDNFKVRGGAPAEDTLIRGKVFYDIIQNGIWDPSELPLPGWEVQLDSGGVIMTTFTDADGIYQFIPEMDGTTHVITSIAPAPGFVGIEGGRWWATTMNPVSVVADVPEHVVDFGNLFFINTPGFARSKGYWHNQGEDEVLACDTASPNWRTVLNGLCLRTTITEEDPLLQAVTLFLVDENAPFSEAYAQLSNYLVDSVLGVLAYNLSSQYAAANLNRLCGALQVPTFIDRNNDDVLLQFEEMAAQTLGLLCNPRSAFTAPGQDEEWRQVIMGCLSEWDFMNSDGGSIFTRSPFPP